MQVVYRRPWWRRYEPVALIAIMASVGALAVAGVFDASPIYGWAVIVAALARTPAVLVHARGTWVRVSDDGIHVRTARIR